MTKRLTCIECPKGCVLTVEVDNGAAGKITGNKCPKGIGYAIAEIEHPERILTSTVLAGGLSVRMVPVRTDRPIPKGRLIDAMDMIHMLKINQPVKTGDVILRNILGLDANLIATRDCAPAR